MNESNANTRTCLSEERWQQTLLALESIKAGRAVLSRKVFAWMRSWGTAKEPPCPRRHSMKP